MLGFGHTNFSATSILNIIRSFVSTDHDFRCFSPLLQELLYSAAFVVLPAPLLDESEHLSLWRSCHPPTGRRRYRSRTHRLFAESDQFAYWWDDLSKRPPFLSYTYPQPLLEWRKTIESKLPQICSAPHCLLAGYARRSDKLKLHTDSELGEYLNDFELVILTFLGGNRDLLIRSSSRQCDFSRTITCTRNIMVVLTPYGNRHFVHGKLPARPCQEPRAATLAFRTAISFTDAFRIYPDFQQHVPPLGPEGVVPVTPGN